MTALHLVNSKGATLATLTDQGIEFCSERMRRELEISGIVVSKVFQKEHNCSHILRLGEVDQKLFREAFIEEYYPTSLLKQQCRWKKSSNDNLPTAEFFNLRISEFQHPEGEKGS